MKGSFIFSGSASKHRRDISSYMYWAQSKWKAFIFLEHTWWIGYNLRAVEEGMPFSKLAVSTLLIFILFIFHQLTVRFIISGLP